MDKDNLEIILEDIREKFDLVLEGHSSLHKRIDKAEQNLNDKISLVDFKVGVLNQKIDGVDKKLSEKIDGVDKKLSEKIDSVRDELGQKIDNVEAGLSEKIDAVAEDLAAHRADTESHRKGYKVSDG